MSHFGVLSYKGAGHLNPLIALSRQLIDRGHRVTLLLTRTEPAASVVFRVLLLSATAYAESLTTWKCFCGRGQLHWLMQEWTH
jgi:hypothetical protein